MDRPNFFSGPYLDRRSELREGTDWREAVLRDSQALFMVAQGSAQLIYSGEQARVAFLNNEHELVRLIDERQWTLLGWFRDAPCVLLHLEAQAAISAPLPPAASFEELRPLMSALSEDEAALLAYARALSIWRFRARYCGACGSPTVPRSAGHVLRCSNDACGEEFFPRIDPAIIVLVSDGERALLGRQAGWPAGRYSTLAGFVEPGESLEDAVAREVFEETGVSVRDIRYRSSQPWPFPSSLMLGFHAVAEPGSAIRLNGELEDARWFTPQALAVEGVMPPSRSISYRLIREWLESRSST